MSFLGGLFGLKPADKGKVLGSKATSPAAAASEASQKEFDVTFTEQSLGMVVECLEPDLRPMVASVTSGGPADRSGIRAGDVIVSVDGNQVGSYDAFVEIVRAIGRPVILRFCRTRPPPPHTTAQAPTYAAPPVPQVASHYMTEKEKEAQRQARLQAAEERAGGWDKRLQSTRHQKAQTKTEDRDKAAQAMDKLGGPSDQATKEIVERVKAIEVSTAASLGYNPYAPRMSSGNTAKAIIEMGSAADPTGGAGLPLPFPPMQATIAGSGHSRGPSMELAEVPVITINEQWRESALGQKASEDIDTALAIFVGQDRGEAWVAARITVTNILANLLREPGNEKYRRLRTTNAAFRNRVLSVSGALDVLHAAGFEEHGEGDDLYVIINCPPPQLPPTVALTYLRLTGT